MTDFTEIEAIIAKQDFEQARALLRPLLEGESHHPQVWYLASKAARNEAQRRYFLEQAVQRDPLFHTAANELHELNAPALPQPTHASSSPEPSAPVYAPASKRLGAFLVDAFILLIINSVLIRFLLITSSTLSDSLWILLICPIISTWLYYGYSYTRGAGRSFGSAIFQLRVMRRDGKNLTWRDAFVRCVLGYLASGIALGAGFIWQFFNPQRQAWHDIFANTVVIEE